VTIFSVQQYTSLKHTLHSFLAMLLSIAAFVVPASSVNYPLALYTAAVFLVISSFLFLFFRTERELFSRLEIIMLVSWLVYPSSKRLLRSFGPLKCKVDLLMSEPLIIHGKYYKKIWLLRHKFNYILCRYQQYVARYTNVIQFAVDESWVDGSQLRWPPIKTHNCSLIASEKNTPSGASVAPYSG